MARRPRPNGLKVQIRREPDALDLPLPAYMTAGSVGMDLCAAVPEPLTLQPGERRLISTGIRVAIPSGYEAQVRPRSGLARDHGVSIVNAPGTIDPDFRGCVSVLLINLGLEPFTLGRGERIAQMVIAPVVRVDWEEVTSLPETARGEGGYGHTGR
jgi:dUTP diphosphatase